MIKLTTLILALSGFILVKAQDTASINQVDDNNLKQGAWVYFNETKKLPDYRADQKVEEGEYQDNLKEGKWRKYYNNDKVQHELTYQNDRPNGYAVFYYRNGNKSEEGIWRNNKWVGDYKYFYENGQIAYDWSYNQNGKREGEQKYYYENGQLKIEGTWDNGKESGLVKEYYQNGDVRTERFFNDGKLNVDMSKTYERKNPVYTERAEQKESIEQEVLDVKEPAEKKNVGFFDGNGYYELKDKDGNVIRKGDFKDGFLVEGEVYQYNSSGKKIRTTVYKDGKVREIINH